MKNLKEYEGIVYRFFVDRRWRSPQNDRKCRIGFKILRRPPIGSTPQNDKKKRNCHSDSPKARKNLLKMKIGF